jgi:cyclopropane fatty-acyl-phospholipid synthase-like methyltransferase
LAETIEGRRDWRSYFDAVCDRVGPTDFFHQVGRTIGGRPVGDEQIALTVEATAAALQLTRSDCLLDLCCGNGLVTACLALHCKQCFGVDFSLPLIEVARSRHHLPGLEYIHSAVDELTAVHLRGWRPTKVAMIFAAQHFTADSMSRVIAAVSRLTAHRAPFFLDDVPDVDRLTRFYNTPERLAEYKRRRADGTEAIGTWWSRVHLIELFREHGYTAEAFEQPANRSAAHYRFSLLARPRI